jgi:hypothetical protein
MDGAKGDTSQNPAAAPQFCGVCLQYDPAVDSISDVRAPFVASWIGLLLSIFGIRGDRKLLIREGQVPAGEEAAVQPPFMALAPPS